MILHLNMRCTPTELLIWNEKRITVYIMLEAKSKKKEVPLSTCPFIISYQNSCDGNVGTSVSPSNLAALAEPSHLPSDRTVSEVCNDS